MLRLSRKSTWIGVATALAALLVLAIMPAAGCVTSATCVDGYVTATGDCEAQCETAKCKAGNVCVANRCVLPCNADTECSYGSACAPAVGDDGEAIRLCQPTKRQAPVVDPAVNAAPGGYGWPCPLGYECECPYIDEAGNCIGFPTYACPNGLECDPNACADCAPDPAICGDDPACNVGRCGDGTACTFNTCDPLTECTGFTCVGAGMGDAQAYCTRHDCDSDDQCPNGFYCGNTRDPRDICGNTCNGGTCSNDASISCTSDGQCQKGNNNFCGESNEPCLDIAQANAAGTTHFESGVCAMRRTCLKREECVPCEHSFDCGLGGAQVCGTHRDQDVCLRLCATQSDCRLDEFCTSYVPAGGGTGNTCGERPQLDCESDADCPPVDDRCVIFPPNTSGLCQGDSSVGCVTDADCPPLSDVCTPRSVCVPAAGRCDASDSVSKFCRHCVDDEDCGGVNKGGRWGCVEVSNGEYGCIDLSFDIDCNSDADCPLSPGGRHAECMDTEVAPSHSLYRKCYLPFCDPIDAEFPCTDAARFNRYTCN